MMIRTLVHVAGPDGNFPSGSVISLPDKTAAALVKAGFAICLDEPSNVKPGKKAGKNQNQE